MDGNRDNTTWGGFDSMDFDGLFGTNPGFNQDLNHTTVDPTLVQNPIQNPTIQQSIQQPIQGTIPPPNIKQESAQGPTLMASTTPTARQPAQQNDMTIMQLKLDRLLGLAENSKGKDGLKGRMTELETELKDTQSRLAQTERVVKILQSWGKEVAGQVAKLEKTIDGDSSDGDSSEGE